MMWNGECDQCHSEFTMVAHWLKDFDEPWHCPFCGAEMDYDGLLDA